jgi:predicted nicotinamide N-methyase
MGNKFYRALVEYLEIKTVTLGKTAFILETIRDTDSLIESMSEADFKHEDRFPYWAELWPSSLGLGEYILENRTYFKNKKVVELGCGLGLAGLAARAAEADVLFTDYDPVALEFTRRNYKRNFGCLPRTHLLDWRYPLLQETYDIIIGADILYERKMLKPLLSFCSQALKTSGEILLADPGRRPAGEFFDIIQDHGWKYTKKHKMVSLNNKQQTVYIYRIDYAAPDIGRN